jgi:hypothetical protein
VEGLCEDIHAKWTKVDSALREQRRNYWLNYSFFEGLQWVIWNPQTRAVAEFPRNKDDDRVRITANRIQPNLINLVARFVRREIGFEVPPTSADDSVLAGARLGEHLLRAQHHEQNWSRVRVEELIGSFLGGTSGICVEWDPSAGEELAYDRETGKVVGTGEVQVSAMSIAEFGLEPGSLDEFHAGWWIRAQSITPSNAQERYGLAEKPDSDSSTGGGPLASKVWGVKGLGANVELCTVLTYYEKPSKQNRQGRHAVVIGDQVVLDRPWPFPWKHRLNVYPFVQTQMPMRWFGHTVVTDAIPLQAAYNHFLSLMHEHLKTTAVARLAIPLEANVDLDSLSDRPGEPIVYDGSGSQAPQWLQMPQVQRWIVEHGNNLQEKIDDLMYVHDISRGQAPGDRNSGLALSVLGEKDETPMALMSQDRANGWSWIGSMALKLYEHHAIEPRQAVVMREGMPVAREWTGVQLRGQTQCRVPLESVLPYSRAAMQAWLIDLFTQVPASVPPDIATIAKMLELPSIDAFDQLVNADVAEAVRENAMMASGEIPSLGDQLLPALWEDHAVHMAEHNRMRKTAEYQQGSPEVRRIVDAHIGAHEKLALQQAMEQRDVNAMLPGAGAIPQADEPPGSLVPPDHAERQPALPTGAG